MANETIAIIGATEPMGAILAKTFARGNHRLLLFSHDMHELTALVKEIKKANPTAEIESFECLVDASWEADIIIFSVPGKDEKYTAERIRQVSTQKIVIKMFNHLDGSINGTEENVFATETDSLQQWLPHSKLVKVYVATDAEYQDTADKGFTNVWATGAIKEAVETVKEIFAMAGFSVNRPATII